MKNLTQFLTESAVSIKNVSGKKYVKCLNKELGCNVDVASNNWKSVSAQWEGQDVTCFFCPETTWVFYYFNSNPQYWAAFDPGFGHSDYDKSTFTDLENLLSDSATIPEFDKFDTNLK